MCLINKRDSVTDALQQGRPTAAGDPDRYSNTRQWMNARGYSRGCGDLWCDAVGTLGHFGFYKRGRGHHPGGGRLFFLPHVRML
jgi:hypothetical protein